MSTVKTLQITSQNSADTEKLGEQIGSKLRGGEILELSSDVGGGKTTFTRGLARGAGSQDRVSSPTFTVSKEYDTPNVKIFHYDFYRLDDAGIMRLELAESMSDPHAVIVIEWSDIVGGVLPEKRLQIEFKRIATITNGNADGDEPRGVMLTIPEEMSYLVEGMPT
ncbi:MAG: tRNA threonylcarbamoyladenosine biosynthesis protein TsaE [Patescibacteria group bacterium]|nr:tRNA (adenosine(37)-N6)-threonylcarbamoyltransferase complex ATPase subunit type 1 TsaE [Candidatus Saccharibacteria bacterium]MDQ5963232.1 tRNA threonylcarbamoyladenosine biosynthesis protein TsaE [Patescibacteria group bacterium]